MVQHFERDNEMKVHNKRVMFGFIYSYSITMVTWKLTAGHEWVKFITGYYNGGGIA